MPKGRTPSAKWLVENMDGSPQATQRLSLMLQSLTGQCTIAKACEQLGISEPTFFKMRSQLLHDMLERLEPRLPGRKPNVPDPHQQEVNELKEQIKQLEVDLVAARVREEIALTMPHVLRQPKRPQPANSKKAPRRQRRRRQD